MDRLPVFGRSPTESEFGRLFSGISFEMVRCMRAAPKGSDTGIIRILHASTDIDSAAAELGQMAAFMERMGFAVKRERGLCDWPSADVLVLGTDERRLTDLGGVLDVLVYRIGLVQGWDVLLYGTSNKVTTKIQAPERPLCAGPAFGLAGICMLHGHIRMRDDVRFWQGFFAHMAVEVETWLDRILCTSEGSLNEKICRIERKIVDAGLYGQDAKMFLAAAHLVRSSRNAFVHSQRNVPAEEMRRRADKVDKLLREFSRIATMCGRADLLPRQDTHVANRHELIKCLTRIALFARRWVAEASRIRQLMI